MYRNYIERFINNLMFNLKNSDLFFETNYHGDHIVELHNYNISSYERKVRAFLKTSPEISDMDICPNDSFFNIEFIDGADGEVQLVIKKIKKIEIGRLYSNICYCRYKKILYHAGKGEVYLYDNSKEKGYARILTYKDLVQQVLLYVKDPVFSEVIYSFLQTIALDENKYFLSDIKNELLDCSLVIPAKISGLCNKHYPNKKKFLETEYKYEPINRVNKEPLSKSLLIRKSEAYLPKNQLQKFWDIDVRAINFYDIDYRKGRDIAKTLYSRLILSNIKLNDKSASDMEDRDITRLIGDYFNSSFTLGLEHKLNYNISTMKALNKRHDHLVRLLAEMDFKKYQAKKNIELKEPKNSPFKKFALPDKFKRITSAEDLYLEGVIQHNCVFSYLDKINNGKCVIYTYTNEEQRYTIEIAYKYNKFVLVQLKGPCNSEPPEEIFLEIYNLIESENKKFEIE